MTFNQYAYDILESMRATLVDDDSVDLRQVKFWINTQRALFLRNEYNKDNRNIDPNVIQELGCVELEHADSAECCTIRSGCSIVRTKLELPVPVELHLGDMLTFVGPISKLKSQFLRINRNQAPWVNNGRFNKTIIHWFYFNHRIYLIFDSSNLEAKSLKYISVAGVFEDPEVVGNFSTCSGSPCYDDNTKYPLNSWMYPYIKAAVLQLHTAPEQNSPTDKENDAASDSQGTITK